MGALQQKGSADAVIAALADEQHGVASRSQLLDAGISRRQIQGRLSNRRLHVVHHGVYAVGHSALSREGVWMAAVLAGGHGALLSHWSAASLWQIRPGRGPRTHVTSARARRSHTNIAFHRAPLPEDEVAVERGIPTTTPARAVLDLAPLVPSPILARFVEELDRRRLWHGAPLAGLLNRYPRRAGRAKLAAVLARPVQLIRSDLEALFLELVADAGLPPPQANVTVEGYEADCVWLGERVIAELDTYATHGSRAAFERDRERDRRLTAAGWRVVRVTDRRPGDAVRDVARLLAAGQKKGRPR